MITNFGFQVWRCQIKTPILHSRVKLTRFLSSVPNRILDYDVFKPKTLKGKHTGLNNPPPPEICANIPPIIFLHGLLGHRKNNRTAARMLANQLGTTLIVPDLRNHGTSFHARPHNYRAMSDDISYLMGHLRDEVDFETNGVIMMGHSMGGKAAMVHALRFPDIVKGVVSIDNVPYMNPETSFKEFEKFHLYLKHMKQVVDSGTCRNVAAVADYLLKNIEREKKIVMFLVNNLHKDPVTKKVQSLVPLDILDEYIEDIMEFKMSILGDLDDYPVYQDPLLIIRANYSNFVGNDIHEHLIQSHFENYQIQSMDSSHWIVTEHRVPFVKMVSKWVLDNFI
ncbi:DEBR0S3_17282g1_1 [Brettanomyces bruxellensis]|uniref:DEBR0S3_17282g1_1 n=1 Tax=Dekkera bruxellensis TaxID=5007 RepID=A0A7D9H0T7_DEKBR|nr:DEBR0S3_17282g1_1 [Brettanomyces bruxellensis]